MSQFTRLSRLPVATIRYSFLGLLTVLLTACSGAKILEGRLAPNPELPQNSDTPKDLEAKIPKNFPSEIPPYPQAQWQETSQPITPQQGITRWSSSDRPKAITDFYQQQFTAQPWEIVQPFSSANNTLIAQGKGLEVKVSLLPASGSTTEFSLEYQQLNPSPTTEINPSPSTTATTLTNLDNVSEPLRSYLQDLAALGILELNQTGNQPWDVNTPITRRAYAQWLVKAYNQFYENTPEKQIRLGQKNSQPAFQDVSPTHPDFEVIQGLAEAGLIPSRLTGDSTASLFRPDAPLTREDLLIWKVPLDTGKGLSKASIDGVKDTWGFQDTAKISPKALQALYTDFQNGEQANVRRVFGYTTLFQPKKPVTRAEAAAALWYFGYQGDGISAKDVLAKSEVGNQESPSQEQSTN